MYTLHYIIPLIIFYFYRDKIILWGLLLANLIDLDHIYSRIVGDVAWFKSACPGGLGTQCSMGVYPLHSWAILVVGVILIPLIFMKKKYLKFLGWIGIGIILHLALDYLHYLIGFGI
jgi:hypothetical protein